ncbi:ABC transporter, permease protein (cluster 10, nitrate/sulfonate/bicarbonate) [Candidatus Syntrophocurvum alkaliphilum]|uniref:ABC transporter, permease protein (Cluster 10, nitrate/sulfonate/bicarbonate) n=1 Tax=Candidatus Syntrophocurvum alkaliphilum TaxID=2293317 RepID=A0A6I6D5H0_9FIRM|nr:ABC transporter permease [Candidatus Syntrophocurvum alkaliphilum]QGT98646.1 ABC transporter, permease protein (cluster 10, nitrate/sulfonate/bicarbonate) [Candidatus Syntrophocurvum alkaliphilum]
MNNSSQNIELETNLETPIYDYKKIFNYIIPIFVPIAFLGIWQLLSIIIDNPMILPSVTSVVIILANPTFPILSMGSLVDNIAISLFRVLTGYCLAVIIAIPLGIMMGYKSIVFNLLNNFIGLFRPIPPLAWVPLVLAWFGVTSLATIFPIDSGQIYLFLRNIQISMIFIIFIGAFFPIITSTIYGVQSVRKTMVDSARTLGASDWDILKKVLIPAAAPSIVTGMRIGLGVAWMCLVSAEMLPGSVSGVGYLITHAYTVARTDVVIAGMVSIGVVGAILDFVFRKFETKKFAWQKLSR